MIRRALSDAQWRRIVKGLPGKAGDRRRSGADNRLFVDAILLVSRIGIALAGPSGTAWQLEQRVSAFPPLSDKGPLGKSLRAVSSRPRFRIPYDRRNHRPHSPACGGRKSGSQHEAIGRSRGALSTKINVALDALANPSTHYSDGRPAPRYPSARSVDRGLCLRESSGGSSAKIRTSSGKSSPRKTPRQLSRPYGQERNSFRSITISIKIGTLSSDSSTRLKTSGASPRDRQKHLIFPAAMLALADAMIWLR